MVRGRRGSVKEVAGRQMLDVAGSRGHAGTRETPRHATASCPATPTTRRVQRKMECCETVGPENWQRKDAMQRWEWRRREKKPL